jgi:hypothetical protein
MKGLILAKIEPAYGTDAAPTAALNAILVEDPSVEPITKSLERKFLKSHFGANRKINIGEGMKLKFKTEIKGSGAAGTPPEIGCLLRASNWTETIIPATSVSYLPNSLVIDSESLTMWYWHYDILHKLVGCRGLWDAEMKAGEYGYATWEFQGIYAGPVDAPLQTGTFNQTKPPRFISAGFAIDSYAAIIETLKFKSGNKLSRRPSANAATGMLSYFISERDMGVEFDPELVALNSGAIKTLASAPTDGGTGYTVGDVLTITTGGTLATAKVLTITGGSGTGPVGTVQLLTSGKDYTTGTGKVATGGTGTGCTLDITAVYGSGDSKNFWQMWEDNSEVALTATLGATAGNICTFATPKVQIQEPKYGERETLPIYNLTGSLLPTSAGNDEMSITFA